MIELMYITNDINVARIAQRAGVDWIFVDLEYIGKDKRQANRNTVISKHSIDDVIKVREVINLSKLLVRVNPLGEWSKKEIDDTVKAGADIVMLPFFKTQEDVKTFIEYVDNRAKVCLLVETMDAVKDIDKILKIKGVDFIHIGLNDLNIERNTTFIFEFLADGYIDMLARKVKDANISFGFGGMAKIGRLVPAAERILTEHYRIGSDRVILARSFCNFEDYQENYESLNEDFIKEVRKIRDYEKFLLNQGKDFFEQNKIITQKEIYQVAEQMKNKNL